MSRLFDPPLPLHMQIDSLGRPVRFILHGHSHRLAQVVQHWQVDADWWSTEARVRRDYWAVTTTTGMLCVVYGDLEGKGEWWLTKMYD